MHTYKTEQEAFWAGEFGTEYIKRNQDNELLSSNLHFFSKALKGAGKFNSVIEFGANIGMNIRALQFLYPNCAVKGIEINDEASKELGRHIGIENVIHSSVLDLDTRNLTADISLIKGVLIHINPEFLEVVYQKLYDVATRYIFIAEYYNPVPVEIPYRGHANKLFKRDFAGDFLKLFPACTIADYGFAYRNDPQAPQDDITWFLIRKG